MLKLGMTVIYSPFLLFSDTNNHSMLADILTIIKSRRGHLSRILSRVNQATTSVKKYICILSKKKKYICSATYEQYK